MKRSAKTSTGGLLGHGDPSARSVLGAGPGILALHGFGASPREVDLIIDVASELGLAASAPLLPGHGTNSRDLARTTFSDWVEAADLALASLPSGPALVAGFSLGSLLATALALKHPERVAGLILLGNAFWLNSPHPEFTLASIDRLKLPDFFLAKRRDSDIADAEARRSQLRYDSQTAYAALEVWKAGRRLRDRLSDVHCPTLILHGAADHVCPPSNAWRVALRLGTHDVRVQLFSRSYHILTRDFDRLAVAAHVRDFARRFSPQLPNSRGPDATPQRLGIGP
jgi:carboxylesterase